jgi:hypothetical protein
LIVNTQGLTIFVQRDRGVTRFDPLAGVCKAGEMLCVSCGQRKGKRACPALRGLICPTCCGTKRLKEIACPADCPYLASAQAHPAAAVLRQRERDMPLLSSLVDGLNATQGDLLALLTSQVRSARVGAIPPLRDEDIREAAGALASTLETAARGIVYEHQPASIPALRVMRGWQQALAEIERRGQTLRPGVVAPVLRRIEQLARDAAKMLGGGDDQAGVVFLDFLDRVIGGSAGDRDALAAEGGGAGGGLVHGTHAPSGLILP